MSIKIALNDTLDFQDGIQDGVSFAYNMGIDDVDTSQLIDSAGKKNEFYAKGFIEGFEAIRTKFQDKDAIQ